MGGATLYLLVQITLHASSSSRQAFFLHKRIPDDWRADSSSGQPVVGFDTQEVKDVTRNRP